MSEKNREFKFPEQEYEKVLEEREKEDQVFVDAGWRRISDSNPFYTYQAKEPEGTKRTLCDSNMYPGGPGRWRWWIEGDVEPPGNLNIQHTVMEVRRKRWVSAK